MPSYDGDAYLDWLGNVPVVVISNGTKHSMFALELKIV
jgi:hypothetical protein